MISFYRPIINVINLKIDFNINKTSNITFKFYDILGKLVDNIDLGVLNINNYTINWNPSNISSGTYFIVMSNGQQIYQKKATFIK